MKLLLNEGRKKKSSFREIVMLLLVRKDRVGSDEP